MNSLSDLSTQFGGYFAGRARFIAMAALLCALLILALIVLIGSTVIPAEGGTIGDGANWKFEIETSGGLAGKGDGGVSINSDGSVSASTKVRTCQDQLTREELKTLSSLIQRARPGKWKKLYSRPGNPRGYADQFLYAAKLSVNGSKDSKLFQASWYDESREILPSDLGSLVEAAWKVRSRAIAGCQP